MFLIICAAGLAGAVIAAVLIFLFHFKNKSIVLPYILFFVFIAIFGVGTFLYLGEGVLFGIPPVKISSLTGEWIQADSESEDTYQTAVITEDTVEIYWCGQSGDVTALYWSGTFEAPETLEDAYSWDSINDTEKTGTGLFASIEEEKTFTYSKGQLSYEISILGVTKTVYLDKIIPEDEASASFLGVHDTLEAENFQFTIQSVSTASSVTNSIDVTYTPEEGNIFLIAVITAVNTTDETKNIMNTNFNSYVDGEKIVIQSVIGEVDGNMPLSGAVSAGMEFTAYTVWEVPQTWTSLQFSYIDALTGSESDAYAIYPSDIE